ncbi:helix-turn-helix domain-containing protein [Arthrobacter sp. H5]|uniref:helix-turn-helix domain-containing protein n=1 Tax=Arthrobacter sp. H5 TaxID=1267973 RepID=UPI000489CD1E|nr:helix-turn-helix domain-containing protein [Arthrobacter sp. H5]
MVDVPKALVLREGDRKRLEALTQGKSHLGDDGPAGEDRFAGCRRAAECPDREVHRITATTVLKWRNRYARDGIEGLKDMACPGQEPVIDELALIAETLTNDGKPPAELGISHWSPRRSAAVPGPIALTPTALRGTSGTERARRPC